MQFISRTADDCVKIFLLLMTIAGITRWENEKAICDCDTKMMVFGRELQMLRIQTPGTAAQYFYYAKLIGTLMFSV